MESYEKQVPVDSELGVKIPRFNILSPRTGWSFKIVGDPDSCQTIFKMFFLSP